MEEELKSIMVVSSFQAELDSNMDDEWKGTANEMLARLLVTNYLLLTNRM